MIQKHPVKRFLPILLVFLLFNSCFDQNDCLITSTNLAQIQLTTLAAVLRTANFTLIQQDSLGGSLKKRGTDTLTFPVFENNPSLTSFSLPLDPNYSISYYNFFTADSLQFNLALKYTTFTRVIGTNCGAFLYYKDLEVVKLSYRNLSKNASSGDTVAITKIIEPQLFKSVATNLRILF